MYGYVFTFDVTCPKCEKVFRVASDIAELPAQDFACEHCNHTEESWYEDVIDLEKYTYIGYVVIDLHKMKSVATYLFKEGSAGHELIEECTFDYANKNYDKLKKQLAENKGHTFKLIHEGSQLAPVVVKNQTALKNFLGRK